MPPFLPKLPVIALLITAPLVKADTPPYRIASVREHSSTEWIYVNKEWRKDLPKRLLVTLRVNADTRSHGLTIKAYFYDKDHNLIHKANTPNTIWGKPDNAYGTRDKNRIGEVSVPAELKKSLPANVYFAIPEAAIDKKWKSVVVVFGMGTDLVARSIPQKALEEVNFPEKNTLT